MPRVDTRFPLLRARHVRDSIEALGRVFAAQHEEVKARGFLSARWDRLLAEVVAERNIATANEVALRVAKAFDEDFDPAVMTAWLETNAGFVAVSINDATRDDLDEAKEPERVDEIFAQLQDSGAERAARGIVTVSAAFAAADAARKVGAGAKRWRTNSAKPRPEHARVNGETVALDAEFSNGLKGPGGPNCQCSLTIL